MVEEFFAFQHRVLEIAEAGQRVRNEVAKRLFGVLSCGRKPKRFEIAEVVRERFRDEVEHGAGCLVRLDAMGRRHKEIGFRGLPVLLVEVPFAALGLFAVHEQAGLAAHFAVEVFHAQFLAALGPSPELFAGADEARIGTDFERHAEAATPGLHIVEHAPFAGLGDGETLRLVNLDGALHFACETAAITVAIEGSIVDAPAELAEFVREVAHGGEQKRDFLLVVRDVGCFLHHFAHEDEIARRIAAAEARDRGRQLIAQYQNDIAHFLGKRFFHGCGLIRNKAALRITRRRW